MTRVYDSVDMLVMTVETRDFAKHEDSASNRGIRIDSLPATLIRDYEQYAEAIGDRLRAVIKEKHPEETYEHLGKVLGITKSAFSHKVKGRSPLGLIEACALAQHLGEDLMQIVGTVVNPQAAAKTIETLSNDSITQANLRTAWQVIKNEYPTADDDERFEMTLAAASRVRSSTALSDDLSREVRAFLLEKIREQR